MGQVKPALEEKSEPTAYCADIDPHEPCMYEWSSKPLGRTVSVRIMRCGSTTPKSAVELRYGEVRRNRERRSSLLAREHGEGRLTAILCIEQGPDSTASYNGGMFSQSRAST